MLKIQKKQRKGKYYQLLPIKKQYLNPSYIEQKIE